MPRKPDPQVQEAQIKPLTRGRLNKIQARIRPGTFLKTFASKLDEHGEDMLEGLFEIAVGHVKVKYDDVGSIVGVDVKDRLSAIRLIMELGAFKDVAKTLLKIATQGRPTDGSESEVPEWANEYAEADAGDAHPAIEQEADDADA